VSMFAFLMRKKQDGANGKLEHLGRDEREHSLISTSVHITGDVKFGGTLRLDGRVDGRVQVRSGKRGTLVVSRDAVVNGPVQVTNLVCDGTINGNVIAEGRVECRSNGRIRGEVRYQKLNIFEGGVIEGRCIQHGDEQAMEHAVVSIVRGEEGEPPQMSTFLSKDPSQ